MYSIIFTQYRLYVCILKMWVLYTTCICILSDKILSMVQKVTWSLTPRILAYIRDVFLCTNVFRTVIFEFKSAIHVIKLRYNKSSLFFFKTSLSLLTPCKYFSVQHCSSTLKIIFELVDFDCIRNIAINKFRSVKRLM